jgi:hypothetical protein
MPTAHYIPLSALNGNGLHPTHLNRTTETALRLDVEVNRSDPTDNNGGIPRTMDVTTNVLPPLTESLPNLDSTVNNGQKKKRHMQVRFIHRLEDLKAYKEKHGHLNVSWKTDKSLYIWCKNIRSAQKGTGKMNSTADGIAALDAIGFDWKSETKTHQKPISFIDRVKALRQYKETTGHLNVTYKANKSLHHWCANIRNARKGKLGLTLTADGIAALDAIGFDWKSEAARTRSDRFQDRVDALIEYKEKNGHLRVKERDDKSLFNWCTNIRSARKGKLGLTLTADRIAALDAIGFDWRSEIASHNSDKLY